MAARSQGRSDISEFIGGQQRSGPWVRRGRPSGGVRRAPTRKCSSLMANVPLGDVYGATDRCLDLIFVFARTRTTSIPWPRITRGHVPARRRHRPRTDEGFDSKADAGGIPQREAFSNGDAGAPGVGGVVRAPKSRNASDSS
jgi:hypothetical protein